MTYAIDLVEPLRVSAVSTSASQPSPKDTPTGSASTMTPSCSSRRPRPAAEYAITQLFFRADDYFSLVERVRALGNDIPIVPGIMPILNFAQVSRMAELSGAEMPAEVLEQILPIQDDKAAVRAKGIELATQLCRDLLAGGAPGLHFITLNRSKATREIFEALRSEGLV
ncbi:methylenetetrahydrofolate reductase [Aeromicrobium sp. UC242_57]|uniref:methylenetetrahydrofolate reductase n=1 Tax=Aeromicrobium sp. UC242_57 TaxID=3374624 RepID=UPI003790ED91